MLKQSHAMQVGCYTGAYECESRSRCKECHQALRSTSYSRCLRGALLRTGPSQLSIRQDQPRPQHHFPLPGSWGKSRPLLRRKRRQAAAHAAGRRRHLDSHLSATAPGIYRYHFEINGISFLDPANPVLSNSLMRPANMVTVPGDGPQLWDATAVPHGAVHHHTYTTAVVLGLPGNQSDYYVYTPPGYDPAGKPYPVLYLLHGWTDSAYGWLYNGRANLILDNLL